MRMGVNHPQRMEKAPEIYAYIPGACCYSSFLNLSYSLPSFLIFISNFSTLLRNISMFSAVQDTKKDTVLTLRGVQDKGLILTPFLTASSTLLHK